jgi:hypothetical protein
MTPHQTYQLWQIERLKTTGEQYAADAQRGLFAAGTSRSARRVARTTVRAAARARMRLAHARFS